MPLTDAFIATCRTAVGSLVELTAFNAAGVLANDTRAERTAQWGRLYQVTDADGTTAAYRLAKAIRDVVNAEADKYQTAGSGTVTATERESAYQTLAAECIPVVPQPPSDQSELSALTTATNTGILT